VVALSTCHTPILMPIVNELALPRCIPHSVSLSADPLCRYGSFSKEVKLLAAVVKKALAEAAASE